MCRASGLCNATDLMSLQSLVASLTSLVSGPWKHVPAEASAIYIGATTISAGRTLQVKCQASCDRSVDMYIIKSIDILMALRDCI
jgi:hypothetical protein